MDGWLGLGRLSVYVGIGGVLLSVIVYSLFPYALLAVEPVWLIPLFFYGSAAVGLIGLAALGFNHYFAKPS